MPPYRDPNRLFYDPVNPTMLTTEQMQQMSPQELQAATDQLDQHLILVLQQIEENFAKCNQVVVESLLPAVEQHGENSMRIYESIKFWKPFFEAAASMRLNEPNADDSNSTATEEPTQNTASPDRTVSSAGDQTYSRQSDVSDDLEGTPRAKRHDLDDLSPSSSSVPSEPQWSSDKHNQFASPFLSSNQNERQGPPANSAMKQHSSSSSHALPELQRLRLRDLPPDSPDVPEPEFETAVFGGIGAGGGDSKGKGRSFDLSSNSPSFSLLRDPSPSPSDAGNRPPPVSQSPRNPRAGGGDQAHSTLLDTILRKNLASPAPPRAGPGSSTPGRPNATRTGNNKVAFPPDLPREWDGIANLSQTSLDAFASPIKRRQSTSTEDSFAAHLIAPPSTIRHPSYLTSSPALPRAASSSSTSTSQPPPPPPASYSSPAKYTRTPAKYAARLTAQNVYDSLGLNDSPLPSPPSILRTNTKPFNMYEHTQRLSMAHRPIDSPTKDRSMRAAGGGGGNRAVEEEESFASNVSSSTIPNQPSFVDPDRSQTRPFDLYEYQNKQNQPDASRGGEDTDNIDDLLNGGKTMTFHQAQRASMLPQQGMVDLGGIVDDDYDEKRREYSGEGQEAGRDEYEDELSYVDARHEEARGAMEGQGYAMGGGGGDEDESFNIERGLRAGAGGGVGFGKGLMDGPEDTLFGMPPAQSQSHSQQGQGLQSQIRDEGEGERYQDDDTFTDTQEPLRPQEQGRGNGGRGFRLHGLSDMETLHGGELLSSEPFQASPLAGRWNQ